MAEEISVKHIVKLDQKNFQTWKFQVKTLLIANDVYDVVDGTRAIPEDIAANAATRKQWIKDNAKAMYLISTTIERQQLETLLTCTNAKEMWAQLSVIHEQKTASNKLILTQRFHEYRMGTNDSVVQHVAKVRNMASALIDLGEAVSDVSIMAKILGSLPSKYNALKTAWDSVDGRNQTLDNLLERLIKEESRLTIEEETASAFAATSIKDNHDKIIHDKKQNSKNKDFECFFCHKKGHLKRNCFKWKQAESGRRSEYGGQEDEVALVTTCENSDREEVHENSDRYDKVAQILLNQDMSDVWITDSGASRHITYRREWLDDFCAITDGASVSLGNNETYRALGTGKVNIERFVQGKWLRGSIKNVLYVPQMRKNLFSVGVCTKNGFKVSFQGNHVTITTDNNVIATGVKQNNDIYRMLFKIVNHQEVPHEANVSAVNLQVWHERLGHVNRKTLQEMSKNGALPGIELCEIENFFCDSCEFGKSRRLPFKKYDVKCSSRPGEFVHSDVCGPMSVNSLGGARYYVLFKDDASGFRHVYFIKHKSDVLDRFKEYERLVANRFGRPMSRLRVDNGREYCSGEFRQYLKLRGIQLETTAPYTPQQNGKAERDNRTIVESARAMICSTNLPKSLWAEAINTAVHTLNRVMCSQTPGSTPYQVWTGKQQNLSYTRIFGSEAFVHTPDQLRKKLDPKAKKMIFTGYQEDTTNYRLYDPVAKRVITSRDVTFNERPKSLSIKIENDVQEPLVMSFESSQDEDGDNNHHEAAEMESCEPQHSRQLRDRTKLRPPERYCANIAEVIVPDTYQEAMTGPDRKAWCKAIQEELEAHMRNNTWTLIPRKDEYRPIDSKWVFKTQQATKGEVLRFKARLCARGFKQKEGIDYTETFSPVVRYESLRVLLAIIAEHDLELIQFDVRTAFLYGDIEEDIYMETPEGLMLSVEKETMVCKLNRSLYGLKQASRCWNQKFTKFLNQFNLTESDADKSIFHGIVNESSVLLALFVDDGLVASKSKEALDSVIQSLESKFEITLGDTSVFAGLQLRRDRKKKEIFLHQQDYIKRIITKFHMEEAKPISVPADPHVVLSLPQGNKSEIYAYQKEVPYREAVGSLNFLATVSRPDITYAVNLVSRYLNSFDNTHWRAVKRIFKYLIETSNVGISYRSGENESELVGFSDADYAGCADTKRSTTGYIFTMSGGPVSWSSKRQRSVSLSTTEAEYVASAAAAQEAVWLQRLLQDIGHGCQGVMVLHIDNQSAIKLIKNPEFHERTKHIDIRYRFVREKYEANELHVQYIPTLTQKADILTKALPRNRFRFICRIIGLRDSPPHSKHLNGGSVEVE